jgi:hypothetical protein
VNDTLDTFKVGAIASLDSMIFSKPLEDINTIHLEIQEFLVMSIFETTQLT